MFNEKMLKDKVVLVTGASRGIGQGIVLMLANAGATVIGTATSEAGANAISEKLQALGGVGMVLNVTSKESIETVMKDIKAKFGTINVLVNNAAVTNDNLFLRMKDEEWDNVIQTNLNAVFRLCKAVIRDMLKAHNGRIINIGSVVGSTGNPGQANYCAAKAGIVGFSKSLAIEVGSREITVNTVAPGFVETDMTNALTDEQKESIFQKIPMKKPGTVNDIAAAVLFLASDAAGYITGQTIHVNGGMFME